MNFHLELLKSGYRKELKRRTGRSLDILEIRRHELVIGRSPTWAPCRIRYYPAVGRMSIRGPAGQYIGWADNLADTMEQINMTKYLPCTTRLVGGTLYILDGEGRVQRRLDPLQTAIEWFQMSNDAFYALYGVNWVPKEPYYSQARRMVHSGGGSHA